MSGSELVLGIESSCDESAVALVDADGGVHFNAIYSQVAEHAPFRGVVPELAARAHLARLPPLLNAALEAVQRQDGRLVGVAVTQGPGLGGALLCGLHLAQGFAYARGLPLVGVDHLQAHLAAPFLKTATYAPPEGWQAPYLALLVSGGHTALYRVRTRTHRELLGQTRDDAAGEAFDKAASLLELGFPGGPALEAFAVEDPENAFRFSRTKIKDGALDMSFSGLKTALALALERARPAERPHLAWAYQDAIAQSLAKVVDAGLLQTGETRVVIAGGVAANGHLRRVLSEGASRRAATLLVPPAQLCTDNAAMVALAGWDAGLARMGCFDTQQMLEPWTRAPERRRGKVSGHPLSSSAPEAQKV